MRHNLFNIIRRYSINLMISLIPLNFVYEFTNMPMKARVYGSSRRLIGKTVLKINLLKIWLYSFRKFSRRKLGLRDFRKCELRKYSLQVLNSYIIFNRKLKRRVSVSSCAAQDYVKGQINMYFHKK
jgi:hypothetical protein